MLSPEELTLTNIRKELEIISSAMILLIQKYDLDAQNSLEIIPIARKKITHSKDYIKFLELSLEGRILGEMAMMIEKANITKED